MKNVILGCLTAGLIGCAAPGPSFLSMTDAELIAYNQGRPEWEQVVCFREKTTGSHFYRRHCMTRMDRQERDMRVIGGIHSATIGNGAGLQVW